MMMILLLVLTACERPFQDDAIEVDVPAVQPATGEEIFGEQDQPEVPPTGEDPAAEGDTDEPSAEPAEGEAGSANEQSPTAEPAEEQAGEQEAAPALETNENGDRIYVITSGDTVGRIAVLYGITIEDIAAANPDLVSVDVLDVGQVLVIPEPGFAESGQAAAPVTEEPASEAGEEEEETAAPAEGATEERTHIVSSGETIYSIGLRYGFTVEELQEYNGLTNPDVLKIGDEIRIPPASAGE